jgi:hypothetical protein
MWDKSEKGERKLYHSSQETSIIVAEEVTAEKPRKKRS